MSKPITEKILRQKINEQWKPKYLFLADEKYQAWAVTDVGNFLVNDKTNYKRYIAEDFDCDDFSYMLMGKVTEKHPEIAFGIVWVWISHQTFFQQIVGLIRYALTGKVDVHSAMIEGHALNCYYDYESKKMMMVEPQNDRIFEKPDNWNVHLIVI